MYQITVKSKFWIYFGHHSVTDLISFQSHFPTHPAALKEPVRLKDPADPDVLKDDPAALGATLRISWPPRTAWTSASEPSLPWMPPIAEGANSACAASRYERVLSALG